MNRFALILITFSLSGCTTFDVVEQQTYLDPWVGKPVVEFLREHEAPTSMIDMIDYRLYRWEASRADSYSSTSKPICTTVSGVTNCTSPYTTTSTSQSACMYELRVDNNVITSAEVKGDCHYVKPTIVKETN